jgi:hypothetical protein
MRFDMPNVDDPKTPDTERAPPPDAEMMQAVAVDLATLEGIARGLGDGLHELVQRLRAQVHP